MKYKGKHGYTLDFLFNQTTATKREKTNAASSYLVEAKSSVDSPTSSKLPRLNICHKHQPKESNLAAIAPEEYWPPKKF